MECEPVEPLSLPRVPDIPVVLEELSTLPVASSALRAVVSPSFYPFHK